MVKNIVVEKENQRRSQFFSENNIIKLFSNNVVDKFKRNKPLTTYVGIYRNVDVFHKLIGTSGVQIARN